MQSSCLLFRVDFFGLGLFPVIHEKLRRDRDQDSVDVIHILVITFSRQHLLHKTSQTRHDRVARLDVTLLLLTIENILLAQRINQETDSIEPRLGTIITNENTRRTSPRLYILSCLCYGESEKLLQRVMISSQTLRGEGFDRRFEAF